MVASHPKKLSILMPDLRGGGAERVAVNLANDFVFRGYVVDMVLMRSTGVFLAELRPEVRVVDLNVARARKLLFSLVRYLREARPDAILACIWPLTVVALCAKAVAKVDAHIVVAEHCTWSMNETVRSPIVRWLVRVSMRYLFPFADAIVAVSHGAADDLARFVPMDRKSIAVIYNPVIGNTKFVDGLELPVQDWSFGKHKRIITVGTLKKIKDYGALLSAFAILTRKVEARLLILGEGDCRSELETQARSLGIEKFVFMPGFVNHLSPYYLLADLFVLSSIGEGLPTVIIEALAAGTPVVSTDCPSGPREILCDGRYGRLTPVGDPSALAAAMAESLSLEHDRAALKARAQDFSIEKAAKLYEELLFPDTSVPGGL